MAHGFKVYRTKALCIKNKHMRERDRERDRERAINSLRL